MQLMSKKMANLMAIAISICFLCIHVFFFLLFKRYGVRPMIYFNIFSIVFYLCAIYVAHRGWLRIFVGSVYLEVVLHMFLAVIFTGWGNGFQNTLIGINILLYYAEYVGRHLKIPHLKTLPFCITGAAAYLASCIIDHYHTASYPLPPDVSFYMQIGLGVVVFSITIFFMRLFVNLTSGSEELLSKEVGHDQLTGLPNRYYISDYLNVLASDNKLVGNWIAMADIDDFKQINDTYGHNCGDYILKEIASILQGSAIDMRSGRWGGEEFLLFGRISGDLDTCFEALDKLRETIMSHPFQYEGQRLRVTMTIGLAEYQPGSDITDWIKTADQRMYEGKQNGKNQVVA